MMTMSKRSVYRLLALLTTFAWLLCALPGLADGALTTVPMADFGTSQVQVTKIHFDDLTVLLSLDWQNTDTKPARFDRSFTLFVTQNERYCPVVPLPQGLSIDDEAAWVEPGASQALTLAFGLQSPSGMLVLRMDESFGARYSPFLLNLDPATAQLLSYTLPAPPGRQAVPVAPVPTVTPTEAPTAVPEVTQAPTSKNAMDYLLEGSVTFDMTSKRVMGKIGRMADIDSGQALEYGNATYYGFPATDVYLFNEDGQLYQVVALLDMAAEDPADSTILTQYDQIDTALAARLGAADALRLPVQVDGAQQDDSLPLLRAILQNRLTLISMWTRDGMDIVHAITGDMESLSEVILFQPADSGQTF